MIATTWTNFLNKGKKRNIPYDKKKLLRSRMDYI